MNKTGMRRLPTELTIPETKTKAVPDVFVVHSLPDQKKQVFHDFKSAFKVWKSVCKAKRGAGALWRGPRWTKLYETPYYPEALSQPYLGAI